MQITAAISPKPALDSSPAFAKPLPSSIALTGSDLLQYEKIQQALSPCANESLATRLAQAAGGCDLYLRGATDNVRNVFSIIDAQSNGLLAPDFGIAGGPIDVFDSGLWKLLEGRDHLTLIVQTSGRPQVITIKNDSVNKSVPGALLISRNGEDFAPLDNATLRAFIETAAADPASNLLLLGRRETYPAYQSQVGQDPAQPFYHGRQVSESLPGFQSAELDQPWRYEVTQRNTCPVHALNAFLLDADSPSSVKVSPDEFHRYQMEREPSALIEDGCYPETLQSFLEEKRFHKGALKRISNLYMLPDHFQERMKVLEDSPQVDRLIVYDPVRVHLIAFRCDSKRSWRLIDSLSNAQPLQKPSEYLQLNCQDKDGRAFSGMAEIEIIYRSSGAMES